MICPRYNVARLKTFLQWIYNELISVTRAPTSSLTNPVYSALSKKAEGTLLKGQKPFLCKPPKRILPLAGAAKMTKAVPDNIEGQHKEYPDPQPTEVSYRTISTKHAAILVGYIIAGNCLCSGIICLCLWGFSNKESVTNWERGGFTTLLLLLSVALGFGISSLLDRIGLLARGTLLQSKSQSVEGVRTTVANYLYVRALTDE